MTRNINRGKIPSELGDLVDDIADIFERLRTLEAPDGNQLARTVEVLAQTVADLQVLVANLETYLDDYIATALPALVVAEVATQLAAALAGSLTIGGNLQVNGTATVNGAVHLPNVPTKVFTVEPRTVVWTDTSNGRIGRT